MPVKSTINATEGAAKPHNKKIRFLKKPAKDRAPANSNHNKLASNTRISAPEKSATVLKKEGASSATFKRAVKAMV